MDGEQELVKKAILKGHNIVLTGQGGTGKTFCVKNVVDLLLLQGKHVGLTCYTGIACQQYPSFMKPMTLHKYCGLEDGRHNSDELLDLLMNDERFFRTKDRLEKTDILFIDEISMVSKKIFEQTEFIFRHLKNSKYVFGGVQVVLCGDFLQLPPIRDEMYGDFGHFTFQSKFFDDLFPHRIELTKKHRQEELSLSQAVYELELGEPSTETNDLMLSLNRELPMNQTLNFVKLFARNLDADIYNFEKLETITQPLHIFKAEDSGDPFYIKKFLAPKNLGLKVTAPVMLLVNINDRLVNGLTGRVSDIHEHKILVEFNIDGVVETATIQKFTFTKFDPIKKVCIAKRQQFPLKLAFGVTIHKAQGMTIPYLEVDCSHSRQPGQLGVAIGRAKSLAGLRVLNYKPTLCRRHPEVVYQFRQTFNDAANIVEQLIQDCTCCKEKQLVKDDLSDEDDNEVHISSCDSDVELLISEEVVSSIESFEEARDSTNLIEQVIVDYMGSDLEAKAIESKLKLFQIMPVLEKWISLQRTNIKEMFFAQCKQGERCKPKNIMDFFTSFNSYIQSQELTQ